MEKKMSVPLLFVNEKEIPKFMVVISALRVSIFVVVLRPGNLKRGVQKRFLFTARR